MSLDVVEIVVGEAKIPDACDREMMSLTVEGGLESRKCAITSNTYLEDCIQSLDPLQGVISLCSRFVDLWDLEQTAVDGALDAVDLERGEQSGAGCHTGGGRSTTS